MKYHENREQNMAVEATALTNGLNMYLSTEMYYWYYLNEIQPENLKWSRMIVHMKLHAMYALARTESSGVARRPGRSAWARPHHDHYTHTSLWVNLRHENFELVATIQLATLHINNVTY